VQVQSLVPLLAKHEGACSNFTSTIFCKTVGGMINEKSFPHFPFPGSSELGREFSDKVAKALAALREEADFNDDSELIQVSPNEDVLHSEWERDNKEFCSQISSVGVQLRNMWIVSALLAATSAGLGMFYSFVAGAAVALVGGLLCFCAICSMLSLNVARKRGHGEWLERRLLAHARHHMLVGNKALYVVDDGPYREEFEAKTIFYDAIGTVRLVGGECSGSLEIRDRSGDVVTRIREPSSRDLTSPQIVEIISGHCSGGVDQSGVVYV
jgi:hypothetical protein